MIKVLTAKDSDELAVARWEIANNRALSDLQKSVLLDLSEPDHRGRFGRISRQSPDVWRELDHRLSQLDERRQSGRDRLNQVLTAAAAAAVGGRGGSRKSPFRHDRGLPTIPRSKDAFQRRQYDLSEKRFRQFRPRGDQQPNGVFNRTPKQAFAKTDAVPLTAAENVRRGMAAFDIMMGRVQRGRLGIIQRAMHRKELGHINFHFGRPGNPNRKFQKGSGFSHIIAKHGIEVIEGVLETIARGRIAAVKPIPGRMTIEYNRHRVVIQKILGTKGQWIITGYKRSKKPEKADKQFDLRALKGPLFFRGK